MGITTAAATPKVIQLRREEYSKVWRVFVNNVETARTRPDSALGTAPVPVSFELANRAVTFKVNGVH
ncbi:hypothetical protein ACFSC4_25370 [Deinococcus malanensis]|uniref:hypothetical protein n=1 Tax=Deinococcus malanensis TaxID=1706855 RepID=UPI0036431C20